MWIILISVLIFPLSWPFIAKAIWGNELTIKEMALNLVVGIFVALGVVAFSIADQVRDVEIRSGEVLSKKSEQVSCEHSYECNCHEVCSGSGKDRSCSESCDTCYEHSYDVDWVVESNIAEFKIDRVDRQGLVEPRRWSVVQKGEPVSDTFNIVNYIKAAPNSIMNLEAGVLNMEKQVPPYPNKLYDYWHVNRVLTSGVSVPDIGAWNSDLSMLMKKLGPQKQANVVILFTNSFDPSFKYAVEHAWLGGKKNDIVVILGTPKYPEIAWVGVVSWTKQELFKVTLRDELLDLKKVDRAQVLKVIDDNVMKSFVRRPMADFEYLKYEVEPPTWVIILAVILSVLTSVGVSFYYSRRGNNL